MRVILNFDDFLGSVLFPLSEAFLAELPSWVIRGAAFGIQAKPVLFCKRSFLVTLHDFLNYGTLKVAASALNGRQLISSGADLAKPVIRAKV